jgi:hypothetical protein
MLFAKCLLSVQAGWLVSMGRVNPNPLSDYVATLSADGHARRQSNAQTGRKSQTREQRSATARRSSL